MSLRVPNHNPAAMHAAGMQARRPPAPGPSGLAAAAVITALIVSACGASAPPSPAPRPTAATPVPLVDPATMKRNVEAFIPEAARFVEQHRGLHFTRAVNVTVLDDATFQRRFDALPQDSPVELAKSAKELRALGLVTGTVDLAAAQRVLEHGSVAGFYNPPSQALLVRGRALTPYVRQVIVHELTHALQDQAFGLDRPAILNSPDEQATAFTALVEGDARTVENDYRDLMSPSDRASADLEGIAPLPSGVPQVLSDELDFPYASGPDFVSALLQSGGQSTLDAAFLKPPTTSAQILMPTLYLGGQAAVPVAPPPSDGPVFDRTVMGEKLLRLFLGVAVDGGRLSAFEADDAAAGWAGDAMTAWDAGSRSCIRVRFAAGGPPGSLAAALRAVAAARPGVTVSENGPVTLTSCG